MPAGGCANCCRALCPLLQHYQQQHEAARAVLLTRQQQRWWEEVGGCSQAPGASEKRLQQLLLQS